jgi:hypothetical protein
MSRTIDQIAGDIAARSAAVDAERERLDRLIARHEKRRAGLKYVGSREFLSEVFELVCADLPGGRFEVSGPFGMGPEWGVTIDGDDGHAFLLFRGSGTAAKLIDTESDNRTFGEGTLGRMNGLHRTAAALEPDPRILVDMIVAQMAENRLRAMADQGRAA